MLDDKTRTNIKSSSRCNSLSGTPTKHALGGNGK